ncbi:uncharacterized protein LOC134829906 [Culicoides brevitarsis]|uniref:uncharacterized protein LOC134829906 n=1 Tax=Culicoides brevitarsis TaxID=469753 RepID=UPI00307C5BE2
MKTRSQTRLQNRSLIEKLPVEMLIAIFVYLDAWSIRRCSECCRTFFHVTLCPKFQKCFELNMKEVYLASHCGIGETFTSGTRTIRTFDSMTLNTVNFKELPFAKNFFMRLGREIKTLQIDENFMIPQFKMKDAQTEKRIRKNILKNFPNLRKLIVQNNKTLLNLQCFPASLLEISISSFVYDEQNLETDYVDVVKNKKGADNLRKMIFGKVAGESICFSDFPFKNLFSSEFKKIFDDGLKLDWYTARCNKLDHTIVEPACITGTMLSSYSRIPFHLLAQFSNLESIEFFVMNNERISSCIFDHDQPLPDLSRIRTIHLIVYPTLICEVCASNLFSSLPNVTRFKLRGNLVESQWHVILSHMPKLEIIEIKGSIPEHFFDSAEHTEHSLEHLKNLRSLNIHDSETYDVNELSNENLMKFSSLPNLEALHLMKKGIFQTDGILNLLQKCPNISIFTAKSRTFNSKMVQQMMRGWPRLNTLILPESLSLDDETFEVIKDHGRFLKYLGISSFQPCLTILEKYSLFEKLPSLKFISMGFYRSDACIFTRSEFHEREAYPEKKGEHYEKLKRKKPLQNSISKKRCYNAEYNLYSKLLNIVMSISD